MKSGIFWGYLLLLTSIACHPIGNGSAPNHLANAPEIAPPIPTLDVEFLTFRIQTDRDQTLDFENGTRILVPAQSLVDPSGAPVSGEAEIHFRELNNTVDIFLSGIPMTEIRDGNQMVFQSAAMMELRAFQNGKHLGIASGKQIMVELASYPGFDPKKIPTDYSQYFLAEDKGEWERLQPDVVRPNDRVKVEQERFQASVARKTTQIETSKPPEAPMKPQKPSGNEVVFDFSVDYRRYPELASFDGIQWQYAGIQEAGTVNPNKEAWVFGQVWSEASVSSKNSKKGLYYITLKNKRRSAKMVVRPVLEGAKYNQAMRVYEDLNQAYQASLATYQARQKALRNQRRQANAQIRQAQLAASRQARVLSIINATRFGVYNVDRYLKMPDALMVNANFDFGSQKANGEIAEVYLLVREANTVIPFENPDFQTPSDPDRNWDKLIFQPKETNMLVAILPGGGYSIFAPDDFRAQKITPGFTFNMRPSPKNDNGKLLRELMGV
ncbi:MAG: hypothetical protein AAF206_03550 [Bacteroidota bacterium]